MGTGDWASAASGLAIQYACSDFGWMQASSWRFGHGMIFPIYLESSHSRACHQPHLAFTLIFHRCTFCIFDTPRSLNFFFHLIAFIMRSSFISAAALAFASAVYAQTAGFDPITQPIMDENVPAGQPFNIVWEPSASYTGTVTIQLLQGATPSTLSKGAVVQG